MAHSSFLQALAATPRSVAGSSAALSTAAVSMHVFCQAMGTMRLLISDLPL